MQTDDRLIYLISMTQQKLWTYLKAAIKSKGIRVTPAQAGILFLLTREDGQSMTGLSKALSADNSTITGLVDRLEKMGLVRRDASPADRRMFRIYITPQGVEESRKAKAVIKKVNEEMKSGFSQQEIDVFKKILSTLLDRFSGKG
jgi:DNA-binding MarR family transcriptional regulator